METNQQDQMTQTIHSTNEQYTGLLETKVNEFNKSLIELENTRESIDGVMIVKFEDETKNLIQQFVDDEERMRLEFGFITDPVEPAVSVQVCYCEQELLEGKCDFNEEDTLLAKTWYEKSYIDED